MGRLRGCLWLTAGLLVALVAGVVAFMALSRAAAQRSGAVQEIAQVDVVVATGRAPVRSVLTADNVRVKQMPVAAVPEGALQDPGQAVGRITLVELYPDEVILAPRLVDPNLLPPDGRMALALDGDKVLMAYTADDLLSRAGMVKPGDHVDLLATLDFPAVRMAGGGSGGDTAPASFTVLQNLAIAAIVGAPIPSGQESVGAALPAALLLAVSPQDAVTLKYVKDAGGRIDIVLRAPGAEQPFTVEPVDWNYLIDKYQIPTGVGR